MSLVRRAIAPVEDSGPSAAWSDPQLVRACLDGDERAWSALIQTYKNLIYSIPLKYGATPDDAADIFQAVCLELVTELAALRKPGALRSWLISITAHQSFHWKKRRLRRNERERTDIDDLEMNPAASVSATFVEEIEREQMMRQAIETLPPRCRELVYLLFYEQPPLPYRDVAARLGLAVGSIGFIRGRCLKRLQRALEQAGI